MPLFQLGYDGFAGPLATLQGRAFEVGDLVWQGLEGAILVSGGKARNTSTNPMKSVAIASPLDARDILRASIEIDATSDSGTGGGVLARIQPDGLSYYLAYFSGQYVHLFRVDSGISTFLGIADVSDDLTTVSRLSLDCSGTTIRVLWNDIQVINVLGQALYPTGDAGIQILLPETRIDSFELEVEGDTTTVPPTTLIPTTLPPTTPPPTTLPPTTVPGTTLPELTFAPTTLPPTTLPPTTIPPVTDPPTTVPPTTAPPTTIPVEGGQTIRASFCYSEDLDTLIVHAWLVNEAELKNNEELDLDGCVLELVDELGVALPFTAVASHVGSWEVRFVIPQVRFYAEHLYLVKITLMLTAESAAMGPAVFPLPVT